MDPLLHLITACAALVLLTFIVGARMLYVRVTEMRANRIHPQSIALSVQRSKNLEDSRAADNYSNLFELPVLLYALCATAIGVGHTPTWLVFGVWAFVASRVIHTAIQCTYNKVMHRFQIFLAGFVLILAMWMAYPISLLLG